MNWHNSKNELSNWYPSLQKSGVLTPKTEIISITCDLIHLLDGKTPDGYSGFLEKMILACKEIGLPAFIRTGMTSGKHYSYCFLDRIDQLQKRIMQLTEWSYCADIMGLPLTEFAIRERLELETGFTSFSDFPINKERRYFFENGKVICHHPYWPEEVFEEQENSKDEWPLILSELNHESTEEIEYLTKQTELVAAQFEGAWSLDWAITKGGQWYAIDMAVAKESFHWENCPNIEKLK